MQFQTKTEVILGGRNIGGDELNKFWITGLPQFPKRDFVISCG